MGRQLEFAFNEEVQSPIESDSAISAVRRIQFCAGHRVFKHESKCSNLHGHNYVAYFHARAVNNEIPLDGIGRVIDFSVLKELLGVWIDKNWDHGFIYFKDDLDCKHIFEDLGHKCFELDTNPTAENMANFLLKQICPKLFANTGVQVFKVVLWETENCFVEVTL